MKNLRERLKIEYTMSHFSSKEYMYETMNKEREAASELIEKLVSTLEHIKEETSFPAYMCRILAANTLEEIK